MHRAPKLPIVLLALALAACSSGESAERPANGQRGGPGRGGPGGGGGGDRATPVEVAQAELGSLVRTTMVSGALEPIRTVGVNAQLPGALLAVRVEEGDRVRTGQVLAQVDAREITAQVRSAEASLAFARSTAERSEQLWKDRVIIAAEYERDRAALVAAQATLDQLRTRLGYASVRAPITGVVTEKRIEAGDVVQSQTRLFSIADVSTLVARVLVSELDVTGIRVGQSADVSIDALGGARYRAVVRRVFPAADTATRMVPVEVALTGVAAASAKPGFLARVTFRLDEQPGILLVPSRAVIGTGDARAVFVVNGTRATRRPVRLGRSSGERVEVLDGVRAGETIVVAGADQLRDGGPVRVVRAPGAPGSDATPGTAVPDTGARP